MLQILDTGIQTAEENMRLDEKLLESLERPTLHLYRWKNRSATFGYFIRPEDHLHLENAKRWGLDLAHRPTGGGIIFHIWDLAFSFLMPSSHPAFSQGTLENYEFVNRVVLEVICEQFSLKGPVELIPNDAESLGPHCGHFCMARPTQYDVVFQGMKVAGAAQRKRKQGYLHQGSISLASPQLDLLQEVLLSQEEVVEAMKAFSFAPLGQLGEKALLEKTRRDIEKLLAHKLELALKF